jgi:hypothetical protein
MMQIIEPPTEEDITTLLGVFAVRSRFTRIPIPFGTTAEELSDQRYLMGELLGFCEHRGNERLVALVRAQTGICSGFGGIAETPELELERRR